MWAGCTEHFCTKSRVCCCHRKEHGRAWEKTSMGPSCSSPTWMVGPRKWSTSSANGENIPLPPRGLLWDSDMKSPCSTKHKAWRMARFLTSNSEYDHPVNGGSKVLSKGMVCVYLQEKHKARSEKDKRNMGTALETHFNTLFLNQIIKMWLAIFGTEIIFKLCRF